MTIHQVERQVRNGQNTKRIAFCIALLHLLDTENIEDAMLEKLLHNFVAQAKKRYKYKIAAKSRRLLKRKSWDELEKSLTVTQFRRYFRMSRECFSELCGRIKDIVGHQIQTGSIHP